MGDEEAGFCQQQPRYDIERPFERSLWRSGGERDEKVLSERNCGLSLSPRSDKIPIP